jgi:isopenicillin-N N-acyltransferase-like protein
MALPLVRLEGAPYEQGVKHGEALRERIEQNLEIYFARFERELKLTRAETLARAERYAAALAQQSPAYHDGMRGIADGSGLPLPAIAALNVRYELFYDEFAEKPLPDGCTAFALLPGATADGHLLIGENWDWIAGVRGAVVETAEPDGLRTLAFTEAGIFGGKIGLNSAGLGLCINGLTSQDDDWSRLRRPFHVRCYEILRRRRLDAAVRVVTGEPRSCSGNFLIAQAPDQAVNLETAPDAAGFLGCVGGCVVHANHFVDAPGIGVEERNVETNPHSQRRHARLEQLLAAERPVTLAQVEAALRDHQGHPYSICFHIDPAEPPEEYYESVTSVIMDLHALTLAVTDGPPCRAEYARYSIAA